MGGLAGRRWRLNTSPAWREGVTLGVILSVGLLARLPNLSRPLLEFPFRQAETAYPALIFHQQGINLLAPQLPVLGAPWQVPFEFPLFQAMAAVVMDVGVSPDLALRICGLICFAATAIAVWGLVRHLSTRMAAGIALVVFLVMPFNVYWSQAGLIEYMATALAVGYAWAGMIWIDGRQKRFAVIAVILGSLAMLVKLTSALFWMVPLLLYWGARFSPPRWRAWLAERVRVGLVLFPVPLIVGALWTHHADTVKAASPATQWLTSKALVNFTIGPLTERLSLADWRAIAQPLDSFITGLPLWQLALICIIAVLRERRAVWVGILLAGVLPVVAFFNLYVVQDYYLIAITPAIAVIVGYALDGLLNRLRSLPTRALGAAAIAVWLTATLYSARAFLAPNYQGATDPYQILPAAREVDAGTNPRDLIVFEGLDWSPAVPYFARRVGMMLPLEIVSPRFLDSLPGQGYRYLFTVTPQPGSFSPTALGVLSRWKWFGAISPHLFRLGPSYASVAGARVSASESPVERVNGSVSLLAEPLTLNCGAPETSIDVSPGSTVTLGLTSTSTAAGISIDVDGQWVPAEQTIVVKPQRDAGPLQLSCSGRSAIVVAHAYASSG